MALSNYTPSGVVYLGQVPWNNGYKHVRLYTDRTSQNSDILSRCGISSDSYSYIARNRTLRVSIPADRLYHVNYCAYRNPSLGSRWIYCFVTDVQYVNDNTTELALETDVFQTFLYGVDWTLPACMVEREHTDDEGAMYTDEPAFDLVYKVTGITQRLFDAGYLIVMTSATPQQNDNIVEDILNPSGYWGKPISPTFHRGVLYGCTAYCFKLQTAGGGYVTDNIELLLNGLQYAGSTDSIVAIFTIPSFFDLPYDDQPINGTSYQFQAVTPVEDFEAPALGDTVDGYKPKNRKLLYYPYTMLRLTDQNGAMSELRYELFPADVPRIMIRAAINPSCQCLAHPQNYMGNLNCYECGITTDMGSLGSWTNNAYQTWQGQNGLSTALGAAAAGIALAGVTGGASLGAAAANLAERAALKEMGLNAMAGVAGREAAKNIATVGAIGAAGAGASMLTQHAAHYKQPTTARGSVNGCTAFQTKVQGVYAEKVQVKSEIAKTIDDFFTMYGYTVNRVKVPNLTGRDSFNFVKTVNAAPKSLMETASAIVTDGGRGTPAAALDTIERCFNAGITFWHTTSNFGSYS